MNPKKQPITDSAGNLVGFATVVEYYGFRIIRSFPKQWEVEIDGAIHLFASAKDAKEFLDGAIDYDG